MDSLPHLDVWFLQTSLLRADCDMQIVLEVLIYSLQVVAKIVYDFLELHRCPSLLLTHRLVNFILYYLQHLLILDRTRRHISSTFLTIFITFVTPSRIFFCAFWCFGNISICYLPLRQSSRHQYLFEVDQIYLQQPKEVLGVGQIPFEKSQSHPDSFRTVVPIFLLHLNFIQS